MSEEKKDRDIKDYLNDILEKIADIDAFIEGMGYEDLETDKKTQYAVIRCLEVIGEAAKKIPLTPFRKRGKTGFDLPRGVFFGLSSSRM